jgi:hypothetical protein
MPGPLNPPPRQIAWPVKIGLVLGQGKTQHAGWFFLISLLMVWYFVLRPIQAELQFGLPTKLAQGTLSNVGPVNDTGSVSAFNRNRSLPVYACHFHFVDQGRTVTAISYLSSAQQPLQDLKTVPVEFVPGKPEKARINLPGYRSSVIDPWALVSLWFTWPVLGLPLIAFLFWGFGLMQGLKVLNLLKQGRLASARLVRQTDTGVNQIVNGEAVPVHSLIFAYEVGGRMYETELKTSAIAAVTDEPREDLLYMPSDPHQARLEDTLPTWIQRREGSYHSQQPLSNYLLLLVPSLLFLALFYIALQ